MGAVVDARGDQFVGLYIDADAQDALVLVRWLAERLAIGPRCDADAGPRRAANR
jgi:hypothetical protein